MKYKVGMYGGSFDPLHIGHIHDIIKAAAMCEKLYVMISWCEGRESTSKELRYRWVLNSCKHLDNVEILLVEDKAVSKEEYNTDCYWEKGAQDIKKLIGKPIDVVFAGDDYKNTGRFESLYCPESKVIYFKRAEVPICSTDIRAWAYAHWDYIPEVCRPHYVRRVLVVGGESTGKSTLVQNLAQAYGTNYVAEVGRETCEYAGGEEHMIKEDFIENFIRQKANELDAVKHSNRILFVDTDALTTLFYSRFLLDLTKDTVTLASLGYAIHLINQWDLVLFLEPTVPFVQDGTRNKEIEANRIKYSEEIKELFQLTDTPFVCIDGNYYQRFVRAKEVIKTQLGMDTIW